MSEEREKSVEETVEEQIIVQDIRLDREDRIAFWMPEGDRDKLTREVDQRKQIGEYWGYGFQFYFPTSYEEWVPVICKGVSHRRLLPLIDQLDINFYVGRVLNRHRLPEGDKRRIGRGTLILEVPSLLKDQGKP